MARWLLVMRIALVAHGHILLLLRSTGRHVVLLMLLRLGHGWLVIRVGDPDDEVLTSANKHAVYMAKLKCSYCRWMEVKQTYLVTTLNVPHYDFLFGSLTASHEVATIRRETCLENGARTQLIKRSSEFVLQFSLERVDEDNDIFCSAKHDKLAIWTKFHLFDLG